MVGKLRKIGAEHGILGGFSFMIKVLFVCHGNDFLQSLIPCISYGFPEM